MTRLITGVAGFIGTNLALRLLQNGQSVIGIDNLSTGSQSNLDILSTFPNFAFILHDITQPLPTTNKLQPTTIYHLACPTGVINLISKAEAMVLTSVMGTKHILDLARAFHAKIIFTSSSEVYGDPQQSPQSESYWGNVDSTGIRSPYEEGKRLAESLIMTYIRKFNLDASIVRVFNTYGPYFSEKDTRVIPYFLKQALDNQPLTVHGKGEQKRTFCFIDDLIDGLSMVMDKGKTGEVYNLGSDRQISIRELAELIIKITGCSGQLEFIERPHHDHQSRLPDLTKMKHFGWKPITPLDAGLYKTWKWLTNEDSEYPRRYNKTTV